MGSLLTIEHVSKRFGAVQACDDVSLGVVAGEVRGLLGQNGAGKSTLMKIVAGIERADQGSIALGTEQLRPGDPYGATAAGVGMVHQHFSLVEALRVWENVTLGATGRLDERSSVDRVEELGERFGLAVDPNAVVGDLAPGERQRVEILKCLRGDPRLIVLDEPTSVLTQHEARRLFEVLGKLVRDSDRAIVLISHRLEEVLEVTDRITVLREGRVVSTLETSDADVNLLASEMLGRSVSLHREGAAVGLVSDNVVFEGDDVVNDPGPVHDSPGLELRDVTVRANDGHQLLDEISLSVRRGEILGIAGVEGNGQAALADVLSGLRKFDTGSLSAGGQPLRSGRRPDPKQVGVVPADRHTAGCVLQLSIAENLVLDRPDEVGRFGILSHQRMRARARALMDDFGIAAPSVDLPVGALSGGNQQRVVLARELSRTPAALVVAQPTQGLDVGAMEYIWSRLRAAAAAGTAVLLISTDLDEIMAISDRICVIYRGRIIGEMSRAEVDHERLGLLMGGAAA